jgi:CheY-like chemotaxis protein
MPMTILVVDDENDVRHCLRCILEHFGYQVFEAQNGREGLQCYMTTSIDAVISDIRMPEMDGLEMIRAICHYDPAAVLIAISADRDELPLACLAGARQALQKPFDIDELQRALVS